MVAPLSRDWLLDLRKEFVAALPPRFSDIRADLVMQRNRRREIAAPQTLRAREALWGPPSPSSPDGPVVAVAFRCRRRWRRGVIVAPFGAACSGDAEASALDDQQNVSSQHRSSGSHRRRRQPQAHQLPGTRDVRGGNPSASSHMALSHAEEARHAEVRRQATLLDDKNSLELLRMHALHDMSPRPSKRQSKDVWKRYGDSNGRGSSA